MIVGSIQVNFWLALLGATGMILGAAYMLYLYRRVIFGRLTKDDLRSILDLSPREMRDVRAADPADAVDGHLSVQLHQLLRCQRRQRWCSSTPPHWRQPSTWRRRCTDELDHRAAGNAFSHRRHGDPVVRRAPRAATALLLSSMFASAASCLRRCWCSTSARGVGYHGQFTGDAFTAFVKVLMLAGAALRIDPVARLQPQARHRALRISGADGARRHRHDGDGVGHQHDDAVSGAGAAILGALRAGRLRARRRCARPRRG